MKKHKRNSMFKAWTKDWPITVMLVVLGLVVGGGLNCATNLKYAAENRLRVINYVDGSDASEYVGLVDSDLASNQIFKDAIKNDHCTMSASGKDDVVSFSATCPQNKDEAVKLADAATSNFIAWAEDIYGQNFGAELISGRTTIKASLDNIVKALLMVFGPVLVAVVVSVLIAAKRRH